MPTSPELEAIIKERLQATYCEVVDQSGGCGAKYEVKIVSKLFEGVPLLQRHRLVNEALKEEIAQMHAFSQKTFTPEQWEKQKSSQ